MSTAEHREPYEPRGSRTVLGAPGGATPPGDSPNGDLNRGRKMYLWRAVDGEGEVLELLVQSRRDQAAASRLLRKLLRRQGFVPTAIVTAERVNDFETAGV